MSADNIAGKICRVVDCRRKRMRDSFYCSEHIYTFFTDVPTPLRLKVRIKRNATWIV